MSALTRIYEELALERPHVCTGCGGKNQLTHSHIVPRSQEKSLECVKENITFHCVECHTKWEHSMERVFLKDFHMNMIYMFNNAQSFYWLRAFKMQQYWEKVIYLSNDTKNVKIADHALVIIKELSLKIK